MSIARPFKCLACGKRTPARFDQCPGCGEFQTCGRIQERPDDADPAEIAAKFTMLSDVQALNPPRLLIGEELDRALGFPNKPGLALGSEVILWGKPGANKTTEMLRACAAVEGSLYINSEQNDASSGAGMLKMLADRAGIDSSNIATVFAKSPREAADAIRAVQWRLVVVDSATALIPGGNLSARAMRDATEEIKAARSEIGCALVMIMHARRDGEIAAPAWCLYMCDTVVQLSATQIVVPKNRFGPSPIKVKRKRAPLRVVA